ncbi:hypothetical protein [Jeotgalibacillus salarius]|uniref:Uncharacterized protein n=1 Tax=Jeotgalibacillus salarius TaxID=546023 RepID=A0A4Y8LGH7_9BACL|nr:hypothetical protein [Jeotgalibacillus salarius]TFE01756.1 hypothetical protein E2626_09315 [Jeotgalibacillus salarius]
MKKIILIAAAIIVLAVIWFFFFRTYEVAEDIFEGVSVQEIEEATVMVSYPDGIDVGVPGPRDLTESEIESLKTAMQNTKVRRSDAFDTFSSFADREIVFTARIKVDEGVYETNSYAIQYTSTENLFQFGGEGPGIRSAWKYKAVDGTLEELFMSFEIFQ